MDGYHCRGHSPAYGSRHKELAKLLLHKPAGENILLGLVGGMENPDGIQHWGSSLVSAETPAMQKKADVLAQKMFLDYISRYQSSNVTPENAVLWINKSTDTKLHPGCALGEFILKPWKDGGRPLGFMEDLPELGCCFACVAKEIPIGSRKYSPPALVAFHELMHVEEICGVMDQNELEKVQGKIETITNLKAVILADEVNKRIQNISMDRILSYGHPLRLPKNLSLECIISFYTKKISKKICPERRIGIGELANFYRNLEKKFGTLADALVSRESIDFLLDRQVEPLSNKVEL